MTLTMIQVSRIFWSTKKPQGRFGVRAISTSSTPAAGYPICYSDGWYYRSEALFEIVLYSHHRF